MYMLLDFEGEMILLSILRRVHVELTSKFQRYY